MLITPVTLITLHRLRERRPGSVETKQQEEFLKDFATYLWTQAATTNSDPASPLDDTSEGSEKSSVDVNVVDKERRKRLLSAPRMLVLVGLPASGKSTFSERLMSLNELPG